MKVITIILNTNRRQDTLACLASLSESSYPDQQIIVLDNASTDGSVEAIRHQFPEVQVVALRENKGYAGNNNVGIQLAMEQGAEWVFVLNEDTVLHPDCLSLMVQAAVQDPQIGVVGPMVYHYNEPKAIQSAGGRLDRFWQSTHIGENETDNGQFSSPRQVDWISGCAILVKREVIAQLGALDERFFYYWEETEWCLRARRAGWRVLHVPQALLWHKGVQRDYAPSPNVTYYQTRNRLLALQKHHAPPLVWVYTWFQLARTFSSWSIKPRWRHMRAHRDALWQGLQDYRRQRWGIRQT
ncbi:MAG: glycosyltransferase family 2 protein [Anaerolinea sp.]|nr:glycosyltransferase family 2 protein [Anaerolinea sp.]